MLRPSQQQKLNLLCLWFTSGKCTVLMIFRVMFMCPLYVDIILHLLRLMLRVRMRSHSEWSNRMGDYFFLLILGRKVKKIDYGANSNVVLLTSAEGDVPYSIVTMLSDTITVLASQFQLIWLKKNKKQEIVFFYFYKSIEVKIFTQKRYWV